MLLFPSYIQISPAINEASAPYVHHILIYLCSELNHASVGEGSACDSAQVDIQECRGGYLIGGWAIGGTVCPYFNCLRFISLPHFALCYIQDFIFPEGVAFPIGGEGAREYLVIEMHYDNPMLLSGTQLIGSKTANHTILCLE